MIGDFPRQVWENQQSLVLMISQKQTLTRRDKHSTSLLLHIVTLYLPCPGSFLSLESTRALWLFNSSFPQISWLMTVSSPHQSATMLGEGGYLCFRPLMKGSSRLPYAAFGACFPSGHRLRKKATDAYGRVWVRGLALAGAYMAYLEANSRVVWWWRWWRTVGNLDNKQSPSSESSFTILRFAMAHLSCHGECSTSPFQASHGPQSPPVIPVLGTGRHLRCWVKTSAHHLALQSLAASSRLSWGDMAGSATEFGSLTARSIASPVSS